MLLEALNTVATIGTFVVIAATAIAALIQLRHARGSNQIAALNELRASQQTDYFIKAVHWVYSELRSRMEDPEFRYQLTHRNERTIELNHALSFVDAVGDSYEGIGLMVKSGLVDPRIALDMYSAIALDAWEALLDVTAVLRAHYGPALWENFEYLAVLSQDWTAAHANGAYPPRVRRIDVPNRWREADEEYARERSRTRRRVRQTDERMDSMEVHDLRERCGQFKVFDIRKEPDNRQIPGSIRADGAALEARDDLPFDKNEEIVLYCGSGNSCSRIAKSLRDRGYRAVALEGGYRAWVSAGFPTEVRSDTGEVP